MPTSTRSIAEVDAGPADAPGDESATILPFSSAAVRAVKSAPPEMPIVLSDRTIAIAERYAKPSISSAMVATAWRAFELVCLIAVSMAIVTIHNAPDSAILIRYAAASLGGAIAGISAIEIFGGYEPAMLRRKAEQFFPVAAGWGLALAILAAGFFLLKMDGEMSRAWLMVWYGVGAVVLFGFRQLVGLQLRRWHRAGRMERRVVIVGGGQAAEKLIRSIESQPETDIKVCGIFDDRGDRRSPASVAGYPKLGNVRELVEFARRARIEMLIVTLPVTAEKRVLELLKSLWVLPIDIRLSAHNAQMRASSPATSFVGETPLLAVFDRPIAQWSSIAKRVFDLAIASAALVALAPVFVATAIAIKLNSKGPVFFRQKRHGFNNQIIEVFKFRSMYHEMADPTAAKVVTKGDPRVTTVGRFIRKSSVDELPQLWNVIRGELSLVGPRPHAVHARSSTNESFIEIVDDYFGRHKVKPGITGWAQINGYRGEIDHADKLKARFDYDLAYIDNWSIALDAKILALTPLRLLKTENAY